MAVAAALHHSAQRGVGPATYSAPRGQKTATEGEVREPNYAPRSQKPPLPGEHPGVLKEPEVQGAMVQHRGIFVVEQILDVPVLQMVDQSVEVDTFFRLSLPAVAEQVIDVPKISCPSHAGRVALREPQLVEQLVEVPTVLSYSMLQQRTAEQVVDTPVSPGRGRGARGGLLGSYGQGSTAYCGSENVVSPALHAREGSCGGVPGLSQGTGLIIVFWCGQRRFSSSSRSWKFSWRSSRLVPGTRFNSRLWSKHRRFFSFSRSWWRCSGRSSRPLPSTGLINGL